MGLDMYLRKKIYVKNWNFMDESEKHEITIKKGGVQRTDIKTENISEITLDVMYWRKANAIHNWFVQTCQNGEDNCQESYVSREQLEDLLDKCTLVLEHAKLVEGIIQNGISYANGVSTPIMEVGKYVENTEKAKELLPTQGGFFFGSTNYDQYYIQDIIDTKEALEKELADQTPANYYYQSSW